MKRIYLSPHLDDAVLSCGGLIWDQVQAGEQVEIWTFFTAVQDGKDPQPYLNRIQEDLNATKYLGAKCRHLNFEDGFARGHKEVTETITKEDEYLISYITEELKKNIHKGDRVYCPLSVGNHVDHVLLRQAAEQTELISYYYIDFPYIDYVPETLVQTIQNLSSYSKCISTAGLVKWIEAVRLYKSQRVYETDDITASKISEYWDKTCGIVLWEKQNIETIFTKIYYNNLWQSEQSVSGGGSTLPYTKVIRERLPDLIYDYSIRSITDIPCGDFYWMRLIDLKDVYYIGGDVVHDLVARNQVHYGRNGIQFIYCDITRGFIPTSNLLICRDCLPHLSQLDIEKALSRITQSSCGYLLTTTFPDLASNWDVNTGAWRPINLQKKPYDFPDPLELIVEQDVEKYGRKCLGLWTIKDL